MGIWLFCLPSEAPAQSPKHEFRGAWIATVINLDWPSSGNASTATKQSRLRGILDDLAATGINSVFFQVRTECDALYDSPFEPWSVYLTGQQGRVPDPYFDPLEFAVEEAHARGLSLHAWLNPFRCEREVGRYQLDPDHPVVENPEWMLTLESSSTPGLRHTILNPGLDAVHEYVDAIVEDILRRYEVDGIHFDDYFYPYPPYNIGSADVATFDAQPRGFTDLDDWRRDNINRFVARIYDTVQEVQPDAVFGISPFGIWRSGTPPGITGLSGADALYADAVAWLQDGTVDYIAPQLYWPFEGPQDFAALSEWWAGASQGRHVYPGLAAYRSDPATTSSPFAPSEIPRQIRFGRSTDGVQGHILFRTQNLRGTVVGDSVAAQYTRPAIPPPMDHRDLFPPDPPDALRATAGIDGTVVLEWDPSIFGFVLARSFAVYRAEGAAPPDPRTMTASSEMLIGRAFGPEYTDRPGGSGPYHYVVTALSGNSAESSETAVVTVTDVTTGITESPELAELQVWPNPFRQGLNIRGAGRVRIYDALGRIIWTGDSAGALTWRQRVPPGLYFVRIESPSGRTATARVIRAR